MKALSATPASLLPDINVVWDESESPIPMSDPSLSDRYDFSEIGYADIRGINSVGPFN